MFETGRVCMKIAGRDAGRMCVIVDSIDGRFVLIDGDVRRRKCNIFHLEPLEKTVSLKKGASHEEVAKAFKELGYSVWITKPKQKTVRPRKVREHLKVQEEKKGHKAEKPKKEKPAAKPKTEKKAPNVPKEEIKK